MGLWFLILLFRIVPTMSFEDIKSQIEEKWKEEIKTKIKEVYHHFKI